MVDASVEVRMLCVWLYRPRIAKVVVLLWFVDLPTDRIAIMASKGD
jgi:hypothetical protein